jgi:predicted nucleic acid-binding Zn ribbon protein
LTGRIDVRTCSPRCRQVLSRARRRAGEAIGVV